jgi:DNA-binding CsgD family transcriptional regulator
MTARVSSPVFIGRASELEQLERAVSRAASGTPSIILVGGEAGIGKSRLVAEAIAAETAHDAIVLRGACVDLGGDDGLPFAPIAEALRELVRRLDPASLAALMDPATLDLARLLPALGTAAGSTVMRTAAPGELAQTRLFEAFLTLVGRVGSIAPVVLVLEDLHWADAATRDLTAFLARNARDERLCVIGTYRTDELHRRHPLRAWRAEMQRLASVDLVRLARFDATESAAQIGAILGVEVDSTVVASIHERAEGNPFFAEELLAAGATGPDDQLPASLRDVLLARANAVSEPARRLLGVVAVGGRAADEPLLTRVSGIAEADLTAALDEATSQNLLVPSDDGTAAGYAFRHALLREALYDDLLPGTRRRLHARYAEVLGEKPPLDGAARAAQLVEIAGHATAAYDLPLALRRWIEAARASDASFASMSAVGAYGRALELWDVVPEADRPEGLEHVELLEDAARSIHDGGEATRSGELLRLALAQLDARADPARRARLLEMLARSRYLMNDLGGAVTLLEGAAAALADAPDSADGAHILAVLAWTVWASGNYRRAAELAEQALRMARVTGAQAQELTATRTLGGALVVIGDADRGLPLLREALAKAKDWGDHDARATGYWMLASSLADSDELEESVEVGLEGMAWFGTLRHWRGGGAILPLLTASSLDRLGDWGRAEAIFDDVERLGLEGLLELRHSSTSALLAVRQGRLDAAHRLERVVARWSELKWDASGIGLAYAALIELALSERRYDDGRAHAERAMGRLEGTDDVRFRSRLIELAIRVESELAATARARRDREAERDAVVRGEAQLELLRGLMATYTDEVSPVFADARRNLVVAEAEATRLAGASDAGRWGAAADVFRSRGLPFEVAWCRYRQAEAILAAGGSRADATAALAEAATTALRLGATPLADVVTRLAAIARLDLVPASVPGGGPTAIGAVLGAAVPADPYGLTARERDVLALLAAGRSNRAIAEALFISESTARVHVSNVLGKLGASNRVEAATIAVRLGIGDDGRIETELEPGAAAT